MVHARPKKETMNIPRTRQGVRDLDQVKGHVLPIGSGPAGDEPSPTTPGQSASSGANVCRAERILSAIGGGALTAWGLSRRSLPGVGLAFAGAALLVRGLTGNCYIYRALGMSTAGQTPSRSEGETVYRLS